MSKNPEKCLRARPWRKPSEAAQVPRFGEDEHAPNIEELEPLVCAISGLEMDDIGIRFKIHNISSGSEKTVDLHISFFDENNQKMDHLDGALQVSKFGLNCSVELPFLNIGARNSEMIFSLTVVVNRDQALSFKLPR